MIKLAVHLIDQVGVLQIERDELTDHNQENKRKADLFKTKVDNLVVGSNIDIIRF
jgi:hypothetical protein